MLVLSVLVAAVPAVPITLPLRAARTVPLDGPVIRVGDVVAMDRLARGKRARVAPLVLATLPSHAGRYSLPRRALAALVHRRVPSLRIAHAEEDGSIAFTVASAEDTAGRSECLVLAVPVARGDAVTPMAVGPSGCAETAPGTIAFEREGRRVIALRALDAGTPLGRLRFPAAAIVAKGDALRLVSRVGPVTIERTVTAMQPSMTGARLFVRDGDGQVYAVRFGSGVGR